MLSFYLSKDSIQGVHYTYALIYKEKCCLIDLRSTFRFSQIGQHIADEMIDKLYLMFQICSLFYLSKDNMQGVHHTSALVCKEECCLIDLRSTFRFSQIGQHIADEIIDKWRNDSSASNSPIDALQVCGIQ